MRPYDRDFREPRRGGSRGRRRTGAIWYEPPGRRAGFEPYVRRGRRAETVRDSRRGRRALDAPLPARRRRAERARWDERRRWTDEEPDVEYGAWYGREPRQERRREAAAGPPERRREWRERAARARQRVRSRGAIRRSREFIRRFRQPIIGLTVAGAAAPLARAAEQARTAPPPEAAARRVSPARGAGMLEEDIASRWAAARAESVRADTVEGAMVRYGIDRGLAEDIYDYAVAEDIEPDVAYGLVNTESAFKPRAVSSVGARGLTQVMPRTARWLEPGTTAEDLFDRRINLRLGFSYLRDLVDKYDGNLRLALLAYNRGPGTVDRVLSRGGDPDNGYADKVLYG